MKTNTLILIFVLLMTLLTTVACNVSATPEPVTLIETVVQTIEVTRLVEIPVTVTPSATAAISPTATATSTITETPTITPTFTISPTFANPTAKVLEQANCRYGPGAAYLYKYGLYAGYNAEIIGRNALGDWAYAQVQGFNDPCWVSISVLEINGDIFSVAPYYSRLPYSALYNPPESLSTKRQGSEVTISWGSVWMTQDDYRGYLLELFLCQNGQVIFSPMRSDDTILAVIDEAGCDEPSSGKLYTAEKHGYTSWVPIPWPAQGQ